jgi:hypothetical protein
VESFIDGISGLFFYRHAPSTLFRLARGAGSAPPAKLPSEANVGEYFSIFFLAHCDLSS